jgi:hypothetical protein
MIRSLGITALHVAFAVSCSLGAAGCAQISTAPDPGDPLEKRITDVKDLAGAWHGWVTSQLGSQSRVSMTIKEDGSYEGATTTGSMTLGRFYLDDGKLRYRSSRTAGTATVSEEQGKTFLAIKPEGTYGFETGAALYERLR